MQWLMPDSKRRQAEQRLQQIFSKSGLFSGLLIGGLVVAAHGLLATPYNRTPRPDAWADISFVPIALSGGDQSTVRIARAWHLTSSDPRLGGLSTLAVDGTKLVAMTDSGVVIRLPRPGPGGHKALFHDLPNGPGDPRRKSRRDSEALTRLADGDWLVAFENRNQIWRYDAQFRSGRRVLDFDRQGWPVNRGVEAMAVDRAGDLLLIPEARDTIIVVSDVVQYQPLASGGWTISDASRLPGGRMLLLLRKIGAGGFRNAIGELTSTSAGWRVVERATLPIGGLDNAEGFAAEPLPAGGTRLWIVTDNDAVGYRRTLLLALDLRR